MGFGKFKKAIGGVVRAIPGAEKVVDSGAFRIAGLGLRSATQAADRQDIALKQGKQAQLTAATNAAETERQRAVAAESVRLQEEQARKRTLFGGEALGATSERKSLLGL